MFRDKIFQLIRNSNYMCNITYRFLNMWLPIHMTVGYNTKEFNSVNSTDNLIINF